ncbi:cyclophilin peptidyl-prolyl cis-trans isomerase Cyp8 [Diplodia seriata]|uniref:Peptidyl-prolyl cis-trans isomerase-like 2 n=1 Tax=Diplodia seriata TaxID=420778 RepID=A0ABR3BXH9_9PEZI
MGKGTDKLYITHSEWASEDAFSASYGAGVNKSKVVGASFRRLPFNFCALSLQPFEHPVCTAQGTIFDLTNILPWLKKHGTNPVDGQQLKRADLIKLNFAKNDDGEYVDPVTYKVFTNNTHIVALKNSGNVFAWDTIERLNIKAKNWRDLVTDDDFSRKDIITLQDPQNLEARDLSAFKYLKDGESNLTEEQEQERASGVNTDALGSSAKVLKAKEAVAKARTEREKAAKAKAEGGVAAALARARAEQGGGDGANALHQNKPLPYNAAQYTTGKAAASFTSTGVTPHTSNERALLSEEEYMLKPRRVKTPGYARIQTSLGELNVELQPEFAPKAVWNFVQLAKKGYYSNISFHRNIKNFMIQGGDPTGTGRGGASVWGKNFNDEFEGPNKHDARGILSMANKGKNTNSSQFFITYRPAKHLDLKHTIFGRVVGGMDTLSRLENAPTDSKDRPDPPITLEDVVVFVDPFEEFQKQKAEKDAKEREKEEIKKAGGTEDDKTTWTGKRVRGDGTVDSGGGSGGVGKYLKAALAEQQSNDVEEDEIVGEWDEPEQPVKKKFKGGGFGNFDNW